MIQKMDKKGGKKGAALSEEAEEDEHERQERESKKKMLDFIKQEKSVVVQMEQNEVKDGVKAAVKGKAKKPISVQQAPIAHLIQKNLEK